MPHRKIPKTFENFAAKCLCSLLLPLKDLLKQDTFEFTKEILGKDRRGGGVEKKNGKVKMVSPKSEGPSGGNPRVIEIVIHGRWTAERFVEGGENIYLHQ
ncbi:hypothetical protein CEXT_161031 [Caerostris extrusa]|uniref:Uncharacterized protein n=1 Tax=Caerostris extrusa TaxID=172846 RepID=A0AAV4W6M1_CAEEX|nr:hypothetical protein CEXT_161031 [Caerostris extrusa]